jgi:quinol monooxygenase YgiN
MITIAKIRPGTLEKISAAAPPLIAATRQEQGNVEYVLLKPDVPDVLIFRESWERPEDFQAHVAQAKVAGSPLNLFSQVMDPSLVEPPLSYACQELG